MKKKTKKQVTAVSTENSEPDTRETDHSLTKNQSSIAEKRTKKMKKECREYLVHMNQADSSGSMKNLLMALPAIIFTAFTILIVHNYDYTMPMQQFYWTSYTDDTVISDFFSFYKTIAVILCAIAAVMAICYQTATKKLVIKRTYFYIPMGIYLLFTLISYLTSDYKTFAWLGTIDRFEGTLPMLCYMVMLFYIVNLVRTEAQVKWFLYPLMASLTVLGILGLTQSLGMDFFQTQLGKMLITPPWEWGNLDGIVFKFTDNEIYQTVYNINYVSFYLTLVLPVLGMLFIYREQQRNDQNRTKQMIVWGALFALTLYNFIGSQSSGGILGLGVSGLIAIMILNKRLLHWKKAVAILLAVTALIGLLTFNRFYPELRQAFDGVLYNQRSVSTEDLGNGSLNGQFAGIPEEGENTDPADSTDPTDHMDLTGSSERVVIDYIETTGEGVIFCFAGDILEVKVDSESTELDGLLQFYDGTGTRLSSSYDPELFEYAITGSRFSEFPVSIASLTEEMLIFQVKTPGFDWTFAAAPGEEVYYLNQANYLIPLSEIPHTGWEENPGFGSGRGYIWSRTLPLLREAIVTGYGADTFSMYFPHNDYAGKYSTGWESVSAIVDKPHNMYLGIFMGTGGISLLALLFLWGAYLVQSVKLYWKISYADNFLAYLGCGIFLGICGFLTAGLVNDSSISVMPMFYGLLGLGIAINLMLKKQTLVKNQGHKH